MEVRIEPGSQYVPLDLTTKVCQLDMIAIAGCRAGPARENKALKMASSFSFTGSLSTGMSSTGIAKALPRKEMTGSTIGTVHFFSNWAKHFGGG